MNKQIILCIGLLASCGGVFGMEDYGIVDPDYVISIIRKIKSGENTNGKAKAFYTIDHNTNRPRIGFCWNFDNQYRWRSLSWDDNRSLSELKEGARRVDSEEQCILDLSKRGLPPSGSGLTYLIEGAKRVLNLDEFQKKCSQITGQINSEKIYLAAIGDEGCTRRNNKLLKIECKWFMVPVLTNKACKVTLDAPESWLEEIEKIGVVDTTDHSNFLLKLGYANKKAPEVFKFFKLNIVEIANALKTLQKRKQYAQYAIAGGTFTFVAFVAAICYWLKK